MKNIKKISIYVTAMAATCVLSGPSQALELEKPTANLTEKWVNSAAWSVTASTGVTAGWSSNETVKTLYPQRGVTEYLTQTADVFGNSAASDGRFAGDYSKIEAISVDVQADNLAVKPSLYLKCGSGTKWLLALNVPLGCTGPVQNIVVPLAFSSDTTVCMSQPYGKKAADFASDIKNVTEIGFETVRYANGNFQQIFSADNLKLIGPWGQPSVDGVPLAWVMENGLTNGYDSVGSDDNDHDGFCNAAEFLAGTDPTNSASRFAIEIARSGQGKTVVRWSDNKYMLFDLLESSDLKAFSPVQGAQGLVGTGTRKEVEVSDGVEGARFYKVQIRQ